MFNDDDDGELLSIRDDDNDDDDIYKLIYSVGVAVAFCT